MARWLLDHEAAVRLAAFVSVLLAMALWEALAARRPWSVPRGARWRTNIGLAVVSTLLLRVLLPAVTVGFAELAEARRWGLLHSWPIPRPLAIVLGVVLLDHAIYFQHVLFHAVPGFWRLHRVHHADEDFDVTTGIRFHPLEILASGLYKMAVIAALGPPPVAAMVFEVLLNATAMFSHGNVSLPPAIDRPMRMLLVTPDMHRVHHSTERVETDSNYGFNLSIWDRLFGTYRAQPRLGHDAMSIGLSDIRGERTRTLRGVIAMPFAKG